MKIESLSIKGWRSFDNDGISLNNLKRINILIGPNNAGKSNIAKYFLYLKEITKSIKRTPNLKNSYDLYSCINTELAETNIWAWKEGDIHCEINLSSAELNWTTLSETPFFLSSENNISLIASHKVKEKFCNMQIKAKNQILQSINSYAQTLVWNFHLNKYEDFKQDIHGAYDTFFYWERFLQSLIFIDPIRHHERDSKDASNFYFDGAKIINDLISVRSNERKKWTEYTTKIENWLSIIANEVVTNIQINDNQFVVGLKRGGSVINSNLSELGTGVAQIIVLLSHLYLNKDKELNIFLDEPESNLHPDSVVKLIDIFERELPHHNFFITTHSSVLIDQLACDWSIHRVTRKSDKATEIHSCERLIQKFEILDELGVKASQVLQSNMVIWVEGPSDAIYLKKWISDISDKTLDSPRHYSFLFYGGSNLASHTLLDEEGSDLVDFLCTSRYVAIFCDTDCKSQQEADECDFKPRVKRTLERLQKLNLMQIGTNREFSDYVKIWLTEGRETENYVPKILFQEILATSPFMKTALQVSVGNTTERKKLKIDKDLKNSIKFDIFDSFDSAFSEMYKFDDGSTLDASHTNLIAAKYAGDKVKIAKKVVENWQDEHYSASLRQDIGELVSMIKNANGIARQR